MAGINAAMAILGRPAEAWADHKAVPRVIFTDPQVAAVVGQPVAGRQPRHARIGQAQHRPGIRAGGSDLLARVQRHDGKGCGITDLHLLSRWRDPNSCDGRHHIEQGHFFNPINFSDY